tara:strand:- start:3373 stop:4737 length:1365 start_codon:yes stop_codon:yes gene_type:complete
MSNLPHGTSFGAITVSLQYSAEVPYTALWYNNYGYYAGVNATYPMYQRPMAIETAGKTFFVWSNGEAQAWATIVTYDHADGQFKNVKKIFQYPDGDGHRNPSLMIDASGYIYVFAGSHGDNTQIWRSSSPYSTVSFVRKADIAGETTYPQPHDFGQYKRVFLRKGYSWGSVWSGDGFATVSPFREVIAGGDPHGVYAITESDGMTLHMMWTVLDFSTQIRKNVWYAKSLDGGITWATASGAPATLPIGAYDSQFLMHDTGTDQVNIQDMIVVAGEPVLLFSVGTIGGNWAWKCGRYVSGSWSISTIPEVGDRQFDCGGFISDPGILRAILPVGPGQMGQDGGNLDEYRSTDGGSTWVFHDALTLSPYNHNNVKRVKGGSTIRAFWGYGDAVTPVPGHLKFMAGDGTIEAIRPGNPYARQHSITVNGNVIQSGPMDATDSICVDIDSSGTSITGP